MPKWTRQQRQTLFWKPEGHGFRRAESAAPDRENCYGRFPRRFFLRWFRVGRVGDVILPSEWPLSPRGKGIISFSPNKTPEGIFSAVHADEYTVDLSCRERDREAGKAEWNAVTPLRALVALNERFLSPYQGGMISSRVQN